MYIRWLSSGNHVHSLVVFCVLGACSRLLYSFPGATDFSMLCSGQSAMIHSVSLPIVGACTACQFENIIVTHFTELLLTRALVGGLFSVEPAQ